MIAEMAAADVWNLIVALVSIVAGAVVIPYLAWLGYRVIDLGQKQIVLEKSLATMKAEIDGRLKATDERCVQHHEWMGKIDRKMDDATDSLNRIIGGMEARGDKVPPPKRKE
jgi:nitrate/TMAO reductase-like tetraheme cytochrome c subunit